MIAHLLEQADESLKMEDGAIVSMNPPETLFGFTYHAHMIPPVKPHRSLVLGCWGWTIERLTKKVWGNDCHMRGIDSAIGTAEAAVFVNSTPNKYDYIALDLWNGSKVCDFIYRLEFSKRLHEICTGLLCMNIPIRDSEDRALVYLDAGFKYLRHDVVDGNAVIWWKA